MTSAQIDILLQKGKFEGLTCRPGLIETHISWVIVCEQYVFKIKKPVFYPFLDFSTLEKRKYYCEREIKLNKRLTEKIHIDVQPVVKAGERFIIGKKMGKSSIMRCVCIR